MPPLLFQRSSGMLLYHASLSESFVNFSDSGPTSTRRGLLSVSPRRSCWYLSLFSSFLSLLPLASFSLVLLFLPLSPQPALSCISPLCPSRPSTILQLHSSLAGNASLNVAYTSQVGLSCQLQSKNYPTPVTKCDSLFSTPRNARAGGI